MGALRNLVGEALLLLISKQDILSRSSNMLQLRGTVYFLAKSLFCNAFFWIEPSLVDTCELVLNILDKKLCFFYFPLLELMLSDYFS